MYSNGFYEVATTPGTGTYRPYLGLLLNGSFVISFGMVIVCLFVAVLFLKKKMVFPKWCLRILAIFIAFELVSFFVFHFAILSYSVFYTNEILPLIVSVGISLIWISYILKSKRVKATFVK